MTGARDQGQDSSADIRQQIRGIVDNKIITQPCITSHPVVDMCIKFQTDK